MQMTGISNWRRGRLNNDPSSVKRIHLIGICGTAMASLAGMLQAKGYQVAGSDQSVYPPMSTFLERLGIQLFEGFSEKHLVPQTRSGRGRQCRFARQSRGGTNPQ